MRKEQEEPSSSGFHNLQPHRDLESNWGVDVAKNLEDYLLKICSGEIADDAHCLSVNFAEAALLLQGSVQVYSRKVEYLYSLVLHALEFITQKSEQDHPESASSQAEENANDEENDPFWVSEEIPVEAKNMLDSAHRDSSLTQLVKAPANLVVREGDCLDSTGDSGELESYLLATCDLYQDFILLDSCDAVAVDFLNNDDIAGKGLNNSCRGGSVGSKHRKSFLSPTRVTEGTANKFSAQKSHDANFCMSPRVEPEFGPASYNGDRDMPDNYENGNCDMPDNYEDGHGGDDGYPEPRGSDNSDDEDSWKPLNPHEPGNLKVKPYRKVNFNKRQGVDSRKRASLATEFTLARLHGTISSDLNDIWEKNYCAMKKQGDSQSPPYEKLRESLIRGVNEDYDDLFSSKENNEENEYDSGDHDFGQPDYDVPELADANEDVTQHGEKQKDYGSPFDSGAHEYPDAHANLEDLCRSHLDALLDNLAETEKQSELAARVSTWSRRIEQNLEEQDSHPPFDIAEYGARVLRKLSLEGNSTNSMSFSDVVMGQKKHEVARTFSALLQLVNNGDVDLEKGRTNEFTCYTAVNPFYVRLLRRDNRAKMQLQSPKERANSSISNRNIRKRKNKGKENQAPFGSSPSAPNSSCRFALKFGKVSGTRCTPESKKRRKSRIVEPVELHTAL
ncbi:condensin-2 complex subunit H2-like [Nicotiana tabacum]|uniref:Condensin-2 complex subunit H2 n=2 Tax=Nicotiana TaxID=4085 RepID=A0A1S4CBF3_TOBAC|nr:PREDICTED: condensin-2 complex subunit H2-like [Nicotiana sylvestris]XP_016498465.1 PREDICTED: condensin-2 complex subunit H2-like [Nicotiana tabacum]